MVVMPMANEALKNEHNGNQLGFNEGFHRAPKSVLCLGMCILSHLGENLAF